MKTFDVYSKPGKWFTPLLLGLVLLLLASCSLGSNPGDTQAMPTPGEARVNGFGTAANHVHAILALPNHLLVLATHYGLFLSRDAATTCHEVPGRPNQLLQ